jgi:hypothetical protein
MYLRQLQLHSRLLAALVILFICGQLFVILIWGIVITPFYNYGMYSEQMHIKDEYKVFEIELNGKRLRGEDFSSQEWDKILLPLQFYAGIHESNILYKNEIKRLMNKMHFTADDNNFLQTCNYQQFEAWYEHYLEDMTKQEIKSLIINYRTYQYHRNRLDASPSSISISQTCR